MSLEIVSLREKYLEDAAALVCLRLKALRERLPLLSPRYEQVGTIHAMLRDLSRETAGVVAMRNGRLIGFLTGIDLPAFLGKRSVYSPEWANGAVLGESRRIYEEMYSSLSAEWTADGCYSHIVSLLVNDREGIEAWNWLGFGLAVVDGVRELKMVEGLTSDVKVRQAGVKDIDEVVALRRALERHLASAPTFWLHESQDCEEWLGKPGNVLWLAYESGEAVGCMGLENRSEDGCKILQDEGTVSIENAFTREGARGRGVATALLNQALEWACGEGYKRCVTDFEAMNILAARFWMRWFEPVCYSLMRCIDERIVIKLSN